MKILELDEIQAFRQEHMRGRGRLAKYIEGKPPLPITREERQLERIAPRGFALMVMGETRTVEHCDEIARNLSYHYARSAFDGRYVLTDFPAADALVKIGSHAYPAIYNRLGEPCSELDIALLVHVVLHIDGRELGVHRLKIREREIDPGDESLFPKNFKRVLSILEDEDLPPEKYSPLLIYDAGLKNPKLLRAEEDQDE